MSDTSLFKTMASMAMQTEYTKLEEPSRMFRCKACGNVGVERYAQGWHKKKCDLRRAVTWVRGRD